jgi:hypothetical protein
MSVLSASKRRCASARASVGFMDVPSPRGASPQKRPTAHLLRGLGFVGPARKTRMVGFASLSKRHLAANISRTTPSWRQIGSEISGVPSSH